jgi:L-asparaginase/Glu-tRNA(Gln) amidotransferase subunit D
MPLSATTICSANSPSIAFVATNVTIANRQRRNTTAKAAAHWDSLSRISPCRGSVFVTP